MEKKTQLVDHLFRHEYGKMVALLSRFLGLNHLDVVEDIVQETFVQAMKTWKSDVLPDNPSAWLVTVAKRKAIDYIRKEQAGNERKLRVEISGPGSVYIEELFSESEIADSQLRMIFAVCHPQLAVKDQVAMTLKIVSGFSLQEIAKGLLTNMDAVKKRIQRARMRLQEQSILLKIPSGRELNRRVESVHLALYLLFNEGYYSTTNGSHIRRDLCIEAMRLCKLLIDHKSTGNHNTHALMALMCLHASRFDSRLHDDGTIVLLENQDRSLWNQPLIQIGLYHFQFACQAQQLTTYHYEAAISAEHARARSFEDTNWKTILSCYKNIYAQKPSEHVLLNQVIVLIQMNEVDSADELFSSIQKSQTDQILYFSVAAELSILKKNYTAARAYLNRASAASPTRSELELLHRKMSRLNGLEN